MNEAVETAFVDMPVSGPGAMLARGRSDKGLSVADIAAQLRYSPKQIEALEGDDYSRLPGTTFVRGMIRGYAKVLGIQANPILHAYEAQRVPAPITVDLRSKQVPFPDGRARSTRVYVWLSALVALLAVAVLYEWQFGLPEPLAEAVRSSPAEPARTRVLEVAQPVPSEEPGDTSRATQPMASPSIAENTASSRPGDGGASMRFEFRQDAWVEVRDRAGRILLAQINPAGSQTLVEGTPPFALVVGNASNVRLMYGEKLVDLRPHIKVDVARLTLD